LSVLVRKTATIQQELGSKAVRIEPVGVIYLWPISG
jgi:hypothetical protein